MNQLTIINQNGTLLTDSREVAKMVNKQHKELLRDIRTYCEYLGQSNFAQSEFFIESTYTNSQNKEQPCYLITKKGCEMIANKMTGQKGVLFTAAYVTQFEKMEKALSSPPTDTLGFLEYTLKAMREQQQALSDTNKRIDNIGEIIALNPNSWREDARRLIVKIATKMGGFDYIREVNKEIYRLIDARGGKKLSTRLKFKRQRMADEGVCKSKRDKLTHVDVIADDKSLIELYIAIVKEMSIKYGVEA